MGEENKGSKRRNANNAISGGMVWFIGWLFTIGYADLSFFKGLLGLLVWPFYLGGELN